MESKDLNFNEGDMHWQEIWKEWYCWSSNNLSALTLPHLTFLCSLILTTNYVLERQQVIYHTKPSSVTAYYVYTTRLYAFPVKCLNLLLIRLNP